MSDLPPYPIVYFGKKCERVLPPKAYAVSVPDDAKAEADSKGLGKVFPHVVNGKLSAPGPDFSEAFTHTPFANDYELDFAKAAVNGEKARRAGVILFARISTVAAR